MDKFLKRKTESEVNVGASTSRSSSIEGDMQGNKNAENKRKKISESVRHYSEEYLKFGFTWSGSQDVPIPRCIVCGEKLANSAMVPAKLQRHLSSKHSCLTSKGKDYFERLLKNQEVQATCFRKSVTISDKAQIASYKVAELIALKQKPHDIAESLILPACLEIVKIMFGNEAQRDVLKIPVSDDTIKRRIIDMSGFIENAVTAKLSTKNFALQIDESTDISGKAQLIGFIRFVDDTEIINQFLFCKELIGHATGEDIFNSVSSYLEEWKLSWENCAGICTDGAPAMRGSIKGFCSRVKAINSNIVSTHCFLHRESLISKSLPANLKSVLEQVVHMVNYIKSRPLKTRMFKKLCNTMESKYECLLLHSEVRWLSRGKVLNRVHELKQELLVFFRQEGNDVYVKYLENDAWCTKLAYLADIFSYFNSVNTSLQGKNENILTSTDKLLAFQKKLLLWKNRIAQNRKFDMFPLLATENIVNINEMISNVAEHLSILQDKITHYFPSLNIEDFDWARNPFGEFDIMNQDFSIQEADEFINISTDRTLQLKFKEEGVERFWISIENEHPFIAKRALNILLLFSTSYLCEFGFSTLTNIKSKKRERLTNLEEEMRVALSYIRPNLEEICKGRQAQISH